MKRLVYWGLGLLIGLTVSGCGILESLFGGAEKGTAELKAFTSEQELLDYFRGQINSRNSAILTFERDALSPPVAEAGDDGAQGSNDPSLAPTPGDSDTADGFSQTTIQEQGVDEADVVKSDGDFLYILDGGYGDGSTLRIVRVNASPMTLESETRIEGWGQDIYLYNDLIVALTTGGGYYYWLGAPVGIQTGVVETDVLTSGEGESGSAGSGEVGVVDAEPAPDDSGVATDVSIAPPFGEDVYVYQRPYTVVTVIDATDRTSPVVRSSTRFDGTQASSRLIDGVLHMVVANYPDYYVDVLPIMGSPNLESGQVDVDELLPDYVRVEDGTETRGSVVTWENLYRPADPDGFGVVSVISLDLDNADAFTSVGIVAEPGLVYSSREALYLTDTQYAFDGQERTTTDIYKFAYANRGATPVASGTVRGRVLNQYSMSEYQGNLRVATTVDRTFIFDPIGNGTSTPLLNNVYVLGQVEGREGLSIRGRLENIATGETIQSARFTGKRGFLVTFKQIDPLFTLDLSDPENPRVVGEWQGPGFSTFMVPMDDDHLLAVGQYVPPPGEFGPWGVQLTIFDVSNFAQPAQKFNVIIGQDMGAYSEALWNPKAFTYFAEQGLVALPISVYGGPISIEGVDDDFEGGGTDGSTGADEPPPDSTTDVASLVPEGFEGLMVFHASPESGIVSMGEMDTRFTESGWYYPSFTRGVFVGGSVYAVTNIGIRSADARAVSTIKDELMLIDPIVIEEPPIIIEPLPVAR